jgi:hypothetical protein
MIRELAWIESDRAALVWSLSCLRAALAARVGATLTAHAPARLLIATYVLWTLRTHAWFALMGLAYRRGDINQLQWLAGRTSLGSVDAVTSHFNNSVPLDAVSLVGTALGVLSVCALVVNRLSAAFRALLAAFVLVAAYWNGGHLLRAGGFEALDFGPGWPLRWVVSNLWLMLILLLLGCAGSEQRRIL